MKFTKEQRQFLQDKINNKLAIIRISSMSTARQLDPLFDCSRRYLDSIETAAEDIVEVLKELEIE